MRQVPLTVVALHDIHIVCMFVLLQMFCPEMFEMYVMICDKCVSLKANIYYR